MTEEQLLRAVRRCALTGLWLFSHTHDSRRSDPGFPDCVMIRGQRIIFAELKSAKGRVRPLQMAWLAAARTAGGEAYLWRPAQWENGTIQHLLA